MRFNKSMYSLAAAIGLQHKSNKEVNHKAARKEIQRIIIAAGVFPKHRDNRWACNTCQTPGCQNSAVDGTKLSCAKQIGKISRHTGEATTIAANNKQNKNNNNYDEFDETRNTCFGNSMKSKNGKGYFKKIDGNLPSFRF